MSFNTTEIDKLEAFVNGDAFPGEEDAAKYKFEEGENSSDDNRLKIIGSMGEDDKRAIEGGENRDAQKTLLLAFITKARDAITEATQKAARAKEDLQPWKKLGMPAGRMGRLFPVSGDEVLSCIRTVQRELHVNPDAWKQLLRMAFLRAKIVNSFARQIYPDYPTLLEWSMLRKMMHNWHFPISCLEENPGSIRGEPKYKAKCFRPGTILPGQMDKLYVATGSQRIPMSKEPSATSWLMLRGDQYTQTGMSFGRKMLSDLKDQYWDRSIWAQTGQSMEAMYKLEGTDLENMQKYVKKVKDQSTKQSEHEKPFGARPSWDYGTGE